jgi:hypothetical protein
MARMQDLLVPVLFAAFVCWFVTSEHRAYRTERARVPLETNHRRTGTPHHDGDPSIEPACQFDGVPTNWTLDRYAREGLHDIRIMLTQAARKNGTSNPS